MLLQENYIHLNIIQLLFRYSETTLTSYNNKDLLKICHGSENTDDYMIDKRTSNEHRMSPCGRDKIARSVSVSN